MSPGTAPRPPTAASIQRWRLEHMSSIRVTGTLTCDADLAACIGQTPGAVLMLQIQPRHGLPYAARIELGTDVADHLQAQAQLPYLRRGALVSVEGDALELRTDHGHSALRLVGARALVIPLDLIPADTADTPFNLEG